jgi:hypothetical protein
MLETRTMRLPAWVGPVGLLGLAWGVSRLRRGESTPLAWGVTAVSMPLALAGIAQVRRYESGFAVAASPVATLVGTALTGLVTTLVR